MGHGKPNSEALTAVAVVIALTLYSGYIGVILGLYRDNGKENGNYCLDYPYVQFSGLRALIKQSKSSSSELGFMSGVYGSEGFSVGCAGVAPVMKTTTQIVLRVWNRVWVTHDSAF